jgi:aldehyde dehydrogenase (NAD+)
MSAAERGRMLNRLPTRSSKMPTELALLECLDNGKPYQVAKATDLPPHQRMLSLLRGLADKVQGKTSQGLRP